MWRFISVCLGLALPAWAEGGRIVTFTSENDSYTSRKDQNYTNGARVAVMDVDAAVPAWAENAAKWIPYFTDGSRKGVTYGLGHNLYTPENTKTSTPQPTDRPYAALLYGSIGYTAAPEDLSVVDDVEFLAGMVGPAAMGREVQQLVHEAVDGIKPRGWAHQLENEPVLMLSAQRRWPNVWEAQGDTLKLSLTPHAGFAVGNLLTYGAAGGTLSLTAKNAPVQDQPLRVRPALPGTGYFEPSGNRLGWSVFGGVEGRAMAHSVFLDGNTFRSDSPRVDKRVAVFDAQTGVAFTYGNARVAYTVVYRSKEFHGQDDANIFGALTLSLRY
ncbi:MAG: lipid A deacylase LpxR family protein [Alphaproteobacteria bacterium]